MAFAALKERAQQTQRSAFGHRFLFGTVRVGAGAPQLDAAAARAPRRRRCASCASTRAAAWRELEFTGSFQARLAGIGVLSREDAAPARRRRPGRARRRHRATTCAATSPRLAYDGFEPASLPSAGRRRRRASEQRAIELEPRSTSSKSCSTGPLASGAADRGERGLELGVGRVESPRGATICIVELDGDRVARLHLRTGSYANWPAVAHAAAGNLLPDFPLINKSFELCYACADR